MLQAVTVLMVEDIKMLHDKKIAQSVVEMDVTRTIIIIILKQDYWRHYCVQSTHKKLL